MDNAPPSSDPQPRSSSPSSDRRFRDKTVIITGAGGNFGRAGCLYFAARGARVAALDRDVAALRLTAEYVRSELGNDDEAGDDDGRGGWRGGELRTHACDVADPSSVESAVSAVESDLLAAGSGAVIDMLWNNAGRQGQMKPLLEYDPADFAAVVAVNVTGTFLVLQAVARRMAAANDRRGDDVGSGHPFSVVNTASVAAMRGTPTMVAYASSKAAILAMTVTAAKDLAPHGIRVNAVSPALIGPGRMWTNQNELHAASNSPYFDSDPEAVAAAKVGSVPMKRLGTVDEVVKSVAFLLGDDSSYITGTNLVVDGGLSAGLKG